MNATDSIDLARRRGVHAACDGKTKKKERKRAKGEAKGGEKRCARVPSFVIADRVSVQMLRVVRPGRGRDAPLQ